ncbi:2-dehydropantoate 2-reductase N-terminal domain-containing protein [Virgisporangium ochraceum]
MNYVVYGAGAVGGVIGGNLHRAGRSTTLVARGQQLAAIRKGGLRLDTADGVHVIDVPATDGAAGVDWSAGPVVLLTVKSHQTHAALDDLAAHAPADTVVVSAQNGVANEAGILRRFRNTYAITVMLPATHLEPGTVVQRVHPVPGILDIGRFPTGTDATTDAVSADLRAAGFESVPRPDIMAWKYRKLLMNIGNGIDAACRRDKAAEELIGRATAEGEAVLAAAGIEVVSRDVDRERRGDLLRMRTDPGRPDMGGSTWQSIARGTGNVEIDYLSGEIVLLGRLHGHPTPVNDLVVRVTTDLSRTGGEPRSVEAADLLSELG